MKPEQFPPHPPEVSNNDNSGQAIDRRRFLQYAAAVGAMAGLSESTFGQPQNDAATGATQPSAKAVPADSRLPDGTEFASWEQQLTFTKTYYVDNQSAKADDKGPGTKAQPFRTVNQAA